MSGLVKLGDIAHKYSVTLKTAMNWRDHPDFPTAEIDVRKAQEWQSEAVDEWVSEHCHLSSTYGNWRKRRVDQMSVGES